MQIEIHKIPALYTVQCADMEGGSNLLLPSATVFKRKKLVL